MRRTRRLRLHPAHAMCSWVCGSPGQPVEQTTQTLAQISRQAMHTPQARRSLPEASPLQKRNRNMMRQVSCYVLLCL